MTGPCPDHGEGRLTLNLPCRTAPLGTPPGTGWLTPGDHCAVLAGSPFLQWLCTRPGCNRRHVMYLPPAVMAQVTDAGVAVRRPIPTQRTRPGGTR